MNQDGVITTPDLLKLQRKALGIIALNVIRTMPGYEQMLAMTNSAEQHIQAATDKIESTTRQLIASILTTANATPLTGKLYYVHTDQLGTPQAMTDETGAVVWRATYDPFGKATVFFGSSVEMNARMAGQYADQETGLHYNYYRDYDPKIGRYIESDPIGLDGGPNTYTYVNGSPLRYSDPVGLFLSDIHFELSAEAVNGEPLPTQVAADAIMWSVWADFLPGSQSIENANWHAMKKPKESDAAAYQRNYNFVMQQIKRCDAEGLGRALHAAQDSAAGGHGFREYNGSVGLWHLFQDMYPTADQRKEAIFKSRNVIDLFNRRCPCSK